MSFFGFTPTYFGPTNTMNTKLITKKKIYKKSTSRALLLKDNPMKHNMLMIDCLQWCNWRLPLHGFEQRGSKPHCKSQGLGHGVPQVWNFCLNSFFLWISVQFLLYSSVWNISFKSFSVNFCPHFATFKNCVPGGYRLRRMITEAVSDWISHSHRRLPPPSDLLQRLQRLHFPFS